MAVPKRSAPAIIKRHALARCLEGVEEPGVERGFLEKIEQGHHGPAPCDLRLHRRQAGRFGLRRRWRNGNPVRPAPENADASVARQLGIEAAQFFLHFRLERGGEGASIHRQTQIGVIFDPATVEILRESNQVTTFQGVERETSVADQEFYQTQYGLLESRSLSERVAVQLRLVDDPRFYERFGVSEDGPAFQLVNGRFPANGRLARQRVAGKVLRDHLTIAPTRMSRLVSIQFTSPDAEFSTRVANAWAENFIQTNLERKIQATSYGRNLLQRQLAQQKERLDESQRQLVAYASQERIINLPAQQTSGGSTSERSIVADDLASLNTALAQATAERIAADARYRQVGTAGASSEALRNQAINSLRQRRAELSADYQRLMTQFEPGYPAARAIQSQIDQLDRSIRNEERRVSNSFEADYRGALDRERGLQRRVDQLKTSYLDLRSGVG